MTDNRQQFEDALYTIWGTYFGLSPECFRAEGTSIHVWEYLRDLGIVYQITIGKHSTLQIDPTLATLFDKLLTTLGQTDAVTYHECVGAWGEDRVRYDSTSLLYYLFPADFRAHTTSRFDVRSLDDSDTDAPQRLMVDSKSGGVIDTNFEIAFGAFDGDTMIACSTASDWRGFADVGVLTHPEYRNQDLAKALVSHLCQWSFKHDRRILYRHDSNNTPSGHVARRLGFRQYHTLEAFKVMIQS